MRMSVVFAVIGLVSAMSCGAECEKVVLVGKCSINVLEEGLRLDECDKVVMISKSLRDDVLGSPLRIIGYRQGIPLYDGTFGADEHGFDCAAELNPSADASKQKDKSVPFAFYGNNYGVEVYKTRETSAFDVMVEKSTQAYPAEITKRILGWPLINGKGMRRFSKMYKTKAPIFGERSKATEIIVSCAGYSDLKGLFSLAFKLIPKDAPKTDIAEGVVEFEVGCGAIRGCTVVFVQNPQNISVEVPNEIIREGDGESRVKLRFAVGDRLYEIKPMINIHADDEVKAQNAHELIYGRGGCDKARIAAENETAIRRCIEMPDGTNSTLSVMKAGGKTHIEQVR